MAVNRIFYFALRQTPQIIRHSHIYHFRRVQLRLFDITRQYSTKSSLHAKPSSTESTDRPLSSPGETKQSQNKHNEKPGAIGGFMRGLIGGQNVAAEDAFVAEAKEQGVDIPPPPPQRHANLVPVRRRRRREDEDDNTRDQSIRDRIFGRFAGSAFMQSAFNAKERIKETIDESNNPIFNMFRNFYDRVFAENEMGMVIREIREEDPNFRVSEFLSTLETELIPKILGAYLEGDREKLSPNCTQDAYSMLNASIREREAEGIVMDTNILFISDVELTAGRLLEDSPVLIVTFSTQQINCLRDRAGSIVEGKDDEIRAVYYAWAFVREAEFEDIKPSGGGVGADQSPSSEKENEDKSSCEENGKKPWKLMEMVVRGVHGTI